MASVYKEKTSILDNFVNNKIEISKGYPELSNYILSSPLVVKQRSRSGFATPQRKSRTQFSVNPKVPLSTKQNQEMFSSAKLGKQ